MGEIDGLAQPMGKLDGLASKKYIRRRPRSEWPAARPRQRPSMEASGGSGVWGSLGSK